MTQISILSGGSLQAVDDKAAGAARLADAARSAASSHGIVAAIDGIFVATDRLQVAASGSFAGEARAAAAARKNATEAVSLLQTAANALEGIEDWLAALDALAETAGSDDLSEHDRAQIDAEFQAIKEEIDALAGETSFKGQSLLQGDGSGNALEIDYRVGTGTNEEDTITVSIDAASVADLDADLDVADIQSELNAEAARDYIEAAEEALAEIRSGVAGDIERLAASIGNGRSIEQGNEAALDRLTTPDAAVDVAHNITRQAADDAGIDFSGHAVDRMRAILLDTRVDAMDTDPDRQASSNRDASSEQKSEPTVANGGAAYDAGGKPPA